MDSQRVKRRLTSLYEEIKWRQYAEDERAFLEECVWIPSQRDPRGREPFELFDHQADDLPILLENKWVIVLKARQLGLSTLVGGLLLHKCFFQPGSVCLWISDCDDNAQKAVGMLEVMYQFLPDWVKARAPKLVTDQASKKEWRFPDGMVSRISAKVGTAKAGASETASVVVMDEFALVSPAERQDNLFRTAEPTIDAAGQMWIISTARGGHNRFAKLFKEAWYEPEETTFEAIFHPWFVSPFVDQETYEAKVKRWKDKPWKIHAEHPESVEEAFRKSGNPRFSGMLPKESELHEDWIRGHVHYDSEGVPFFDHEAGSPLRVRGDVAVNGPDTWRDYVLFVDPALGRGQDYTAAQVLVLDDDGNVEVCAWWRDNLTEAVEAGRQFARLGRYFGEAILAVENSGGWGESMLTELRLNDKYPNLYYYEPATKTRKKGRGARAGFSMNRKLRPLVVDGLAEVLSSDDMKVFYLYEELARELETFVVTEDGRVEADVGCHDDLVMSMGGAVYVLLEKTDIQREPVDEPEEDVKRRGTLAPMWEEIEQVRERKRERMEKDMRKLERRRRKNDRRRNRRSGLLVNGSRRR